jgi:hypothetical protein
MKWILIIVLVVVLAALFFMRGKQNKDQKK